MARNSSDDTEILPAHLLGVPWGSVHDRKEVLILPVLRGEDGRIIIKNPAGKSGGKFFQKIKNIFAKPLDILIKV